MRLHLTLLAGLTICVGAFVIEVLRALGGNTLSWAYVFEWPAFAGFSLYMWWTLLTGRERNRPASAGAVISEDKEFDEKLEAWNRYLREMGGAEPVEPDRAT